MIQSPVTISSPCLAPFQQCADSQPNQDQSPLAPFQFALHVYRYRKTSLVTWKPDVMINQVSRVFYHSIKTHYEFHYCFFLILGHRAFPSKMKVNFSAPLLSQKTLCPH
jgi:hypothetical protein